ncbi:hypothetical protein MCP1_90032 [Candidatus Terasakiella magnetica]|nr:hypothetical protein MCP1_90032 [Candidatus Terasakiella magnetica]
MSTDALVVTHSFALRGAAPDSVTATLKERPGVKDVHTGKNGRNLSVTYDLRFLRFDDIEQTVDKFGARPAIGFVSTIRRSWKRFTEENLLASVSAPVSPCCNRPPDTK